MQINQSNLEALYKGYRTIFLEGFQGTTQTLAARAAMMTTSRSAQELYKWLGAVPGMKEFLGEASIENLSSHGFAIANKTFHDTVGVPREDIERDTYGIYNPMFAAMGDAAKQHPDALLAAAMLAGFTSQCYTGKNFFDTNHEPEKGGVKFSNKGTKKLSSDNFRAARAALKSVRNAKGRPIGNGRQLQLVVSPDYEATARQILVADVVANNTNVDKGTATLEVWPELAASPHAWFLLEVGKSVKPFINQQEKATEFNAATDPKTLNVMLTQQFVYQAYGRYNLSYGLPELAWGSTGADAA